MDQTVLPTQSGNPSCAIRLQNLSARLPWCEMSVQDLQIYCGSFFYSDKDIHILLLLDAIKHLWLK